MVGFFDFFDAYQVNGQRHPKGLLYAQACTDFGLTQDMMQPTLMMLPGELLTVHDMWMMCSWLEAKRG